MATFIDKEDNILDHYIAKKKEIASHLKEYV